MFHLLQKKHPTFGCGVKLPLVPPALASSAGLRPPPAPQMNIYIPSHDLAKHNEVMKDPAGATSAKAIIQRADEPLACQMFAHNDTTIII